MVSTSALLRADHVGIRELKNHLSQRLRTNKPIVITDRGNPSKVIVSYRDLIELLDVMDELQDLETLRIVREGRKVVREGAKGVLVSEIFKKIRANR